MFPLNLAQVELFPPDLGAIFILHQNIRVQQTVEVISSICVNALRSAPLADGLVPACKQNPILISSSTHLQDRWAERSKVMTQPTSWVHAKHQSISCRQTRQEIFKALLSLSRSLSDRENLDPGTRNSICYLTSCTLYTQLWQIKQTHLKHSAQGLSPRLVPWLVATVLPGPE